LFIAGGDQYEYWTNWTNTRVQESVQMLVDNGTSIGGTSAGMAVMGEASTMFIMQFKLF
jgi:cyanophycinase